jgi:predicted transcriptional regulator
LLDNPILTIKKCKYNEKLNKYRTRNRESSMTTINKQEQILSERFEVAFNQVHEALRNIVKIPDDRFYVLLKVGAKNYQIIETYRRDLEQYAKLRNALVHEKLEVGYYIAEPNIKVVEHIEKIAKIFSRPNYALSIATKKVVYFNYDDNILNVIEAIRDFGYSQYPIYKNNDCIGLLTTGDIVNWMAKNVVNNHVNFSNITVSNVTVNEETHPVRFVPKNSNIFDVENF